MRDAIIAREPHRAYQAVVDLMRTSDSDLMQMLGIAKAS
ncbi:DNA-binding FadR family transcriptional regulator [Bradyrhizobium sp. OAE829]